MSSDFVFEETNATLGDNIVYVNSKGSLQRLKPRSVTDSFYKKLFNFWCQVLLPCGWPNSVSDDYIPYQIWDSAQALCSGVTGILSTRAILVGVGVGNAESKAGAATIAWILKDGTGMCGRILFAWWKGNGLDSDCKKWRLFADFLNDCALSFEIFIPYFMSYSTEILCISTAMKAIVGVAGGATRAAITQHQALRGNMGDVSAKDGSQETFVNLLSSFLGVLILTLFPEGVYDWPLFFIFTLIHLYTNYKAVKALNIRTLNEARYNLLVNHYLRTGNVESPRLINDQESVILGMGLKAENLCNFNIKIGSSLQSLSQPVPTQIFERLLNIYGGDNFILVADLETSTIHILLEHRNKDETVLEAYFCALYLGVELSLYNDLPLVVNTGMVIEKIQNVKVSKKTCTDLTDLPIDDKHAIFRLAHEEYMVFRQNLEHLDWRLEAHQMKVDEWRYQL